jgi:hypothetical protein
VPFQIAGPYCSKNSALNVCAARSRTGGFHNAKATAVTVLSSSAGIPGFCSKRRPIFGTYSFEA